MPIYEYRCEPCEHSFETLIRHAGDAAHCPKCGTTHVSKQFSVPAAAQSGSATSSLPICGQPSQNAFGCGAGGCGSGMCSMN
jgi:putative FmdB family regulatory protein